MRKYKRISFLTPVFDRTKRDIDELVSEEINNRIQTWIKSFKTAPEYHIINADTFIDPRTRTDPGLDSAYTIIHIEFSENNYRSTVK